MATSKKIFSILFLLVSTLLFSQSNELVFRKLLKKYDKIKSFSAVFEQMNYWKEIDDTLYATGKIFYNENKLLFDYQKPKKQIMLVDTSSVLIWDMVENQAFITKNNTDISKPIDVIKRYWKQSKKEILKKENKFYITLVDESQTIEVVTKDLIIQKMKITNSNGNIVEYQFKKIKINPKLDKKIFEIKLPEDIKIFKN